MTIRSVEPHNLEGQDDNHAEAVGQAMMPPPQTIDPQVAVALAQAYSQFTIVLKRLLETPHPATKPPKQRSDRASKQLHEAESKANLSIATPYSPELSHTLPVGKR
ncbi:hypothetical protein JCGZ_27093 [Jatropha curcas]|uniref:Uncharacterized protein n=1 Tax=Jatropha curcas TaxID=180498 RepID=A0A067JM90_JATCU|nr:hypothetical protein JCGZ_27093 [Jatropha curcas]